MIIWRLESEETRQGVFKIGLADDKLYDLPAPYSDGVWSRYDNLVDTHGEHVVGIKKDWIFGFANLDQYLRATDSEWRRSPWGRSVLRGARRDLVLSAYAVSDKRHYVRTRCQVAFYREGAKRISVLRSLAYVENIPNECHRNNRKALNELRGLVAQFERTPTV